MESLFATLKLNILAVNNLIDNSDHLSQNIKKTAFLAENVSSKVKQLDITRNRIAECQNRVHDLLDLQLCRNFVAQAFLVEDYEKVALHVNRFLLMDKVLLRKTANDVSEPLSNISSAVLALEKAVKQLYEIVTTKFEEAIRNEDICNVERFFKIYPLLERHDEGIDRFFTFICEKLHLKNQKYLKNYMEDLNNMKKSPILFADITSYILESFAQVIKLNHPLLINHYGYGKLHVALKILQKECDKEMKSLIQCFKTNRKISEISLQFEEDKKTTNLSSSAGQFFKPTDTLKDKLDAKQADNLSNELVLIHSRCVLYMRFLKRKIKEDLAGTTLLERNKDTKLQEFETELLSSELKTSMHEVISIYVSMEAYFMKESVVKAISLDTKGSTEEQYSSVVDDVFFIFKKCIKRSMATHSLECTCAVINNCTSCLEQIYIPHLQDSLKVGISSTYVDLANAYNTIQNTIQQRFQNTNEYHTKNLEYCIYLNNADKSIKFIDTLCNTIADDFRNTFGKGESTHIFDSCLSSFSASKDSLKSVINSGIQLLRSTTIKPRLHPWIDNFLTYDYQPVGSEISELVSTDRFSQFLLTKLEDFLESYKKYLNEENYFTLQEMLIMEIAIRLERVIKKSRFNQIGGLLLEQDIRNITSYFSHLSSWVVKEKLTRLTQIAAILAAHDIKDVSYFTKEKDKANNNFKLSHKEIITILQLRTD